MMPLVLASSSRYRQAQLQTLGLSFTCLSPDIDESARPGENAIALARRLAAAKAQAVAVRCQPGALVIGADQTVAFGDVILGKPGSFAAAVAQLRQLRGQTATFHSALALFDTRNATLQLQVVDTVVRYRPLTDTQVNAYLARDKPFDCAGSFKSEALGIALLESVRSDDPTALVGLPLIALTTMLAMAGADVLLAHAP